MQQAHDQFESLVAARTAALSEANATLEKANLALQAETSQRQHLQAESQRFFDFSLDKLCVIGFDGFFKRLNPSWEPSLGWTREELMAQPFLDFVHPEDRKKTESEQERNTKGRHTELFENRFRCKDGTYKWLAWRARSVPDEQAIYAAARDITGSKRVEYALQEAMAQLERSNGELQNFASIASHDLQEPLRAIQAFSDRLQTKHGAALDEEGRDYLTRMQNAAGRMRALIQDLLTYSRVTTRVRPFTPVDLKLAIEAVLADLEINLEETGGRVEVGELPAIEADAMQMRQLFQNLISNALKFHREDEPPVVRIYTPPETSAAGQMVHIAVEDNGIGFDEKFADRIFSPFERLHNQRKYSGTGIGLAICRRISERHGGEISVQSAPGKGSRFLISLPVEQPEAAAENEMQNNEA